MRIENSFIPVRGVGEATERRLWSRGVTHWDEFDPELVGPTTARRIDEYIRTARRKLDDEEFAFFAKTVPGKCQWRLYENAAERAAYLDIETTGLSKQIHDVTTVSIHSAGETTTLVRDRDLSASTLTDALEDASMLVTFNGRRFDVPFLEESFGVTIDVPHLDLYSPCRRIGLTGGLKTVERTLGIDRVQDDISGRDAVALWHAYERGNERALETLIEYNRADTENLVPLARTVTDRLDEQVFASACNRELTG